MSATDCQTCRRLVESVDRAYSNGGHAIGAVYAIKYAVAPSSAPERLKVSVGYDLSAAQVLDRDGRVVLSAPAGQGGQSEVDVVRVGSAWRIAEITRLGVNS